ncbi:hypothetical protein DL240_08070 [Lujinxingia litoralis]|uniref:Cytochrome c-type biogenesis protein n=1 Tax=Lujinxingia litoralis TaxID=2211119 RepID=A0A328C840_9DELT|nr:cytochrome c-type biogenesis protein CcmH [Lujinxingia litoralis]RAL22840.1 hypothetical protein DL240_08070 [Lujinxingia litoralis]
MKRTNQLGAALLVVMLVSMPGWMVGAQEPQDRLPDDVSRVTREVSQEIYSPYCPGKTLAMCPSANAAVARMDIQEMASQGMEKEAIKAELIARYGEGFEVVEPPPEDNAKLLGSILAGLLVAVVAVVALARRRRGGDGSAELGADEGSALEEGDELDEDYLDELREDYLS